MEINVLGFKDNSIFLKFCKGSLSLFEIIICLRISAILLQSTSLSPRGTLDAIASYRLNDFTILEPPFFKGVLGFEGQLYFFADKF